MPGKKNPWGEPEPTDPWQDEPPTQTHQTGSRPKLRVQKPHRLELIEGPGSPKSFVLEADELVLGRSPQADLRVDSGEVSRQHLRLIRNEEEYTCEDLGSRNGIFLNGVKVHSAVLRDQDQLQVADLIFVYHGGT